MTKTSSFEKLKEYVERARRKSFKDAAAYSGYSVKRAKELVKAEFPDSFGDFRDAFPIKPQPPPPPPLRVPKIDKRSPQQKRLEEFIKERETFTIQEAAEASGYSYNVCCKVIRERYPDAMERVVRAQRRRTPTLKLKRLDEYVAEHGSQISFKEAAEESGYSYDNARRAIREKYPELFAVGVQNERRDRFNEYVELHPEGVNIVELATYSGYCQSNCRRILREEFPDVEITRSEQPSADRAQEISALIDEYERSGEPPHIAMAVEWLRKRSSFAPNSLQFACQKRPFFKSEESAFCYRYVRLRNGAGQPREKTLGELKRALVIREKLLGIEGTIPIANAALIVDATEEEARLVACAEEIESFFIMDDEVGEDFNYAYDRQLEAACVAPPPEMVEDWLKRGLYGVYLPPEPWARYLEILNYKIRSKTWRRQFYETLREG